MFTKEVGTSSLNKDNTKCEPITEKFEEKAKIEVDKG
jgi:hypothetical protein